MEQLFSALKAMEGQKIAGQISRLGLEPYVRELEEKGLTVVPPEVTGMSPERCDRMVGLLLARAEASTGCGFSLAAGPAEELRFPKGFVDPLWLASASSAPKGKPPPPSQLQLQQLAQQDRAFRDMAVHPVAVALVQQLMGSQVCLSSTNCFIKWRGEGYGQNLGMHVDQATPAPFGPCLNCNANWCLTDYTKEGGAFAYVPGSHKLQKYPSLPEAVEKAVAVEVPRGSLIFFHGQTWHGAFPRLTDGLRVTVSMYYRHKVIVPQEDLPNIFPPELIEDCDDPKMLQRLVAIKQRPYRKQIMPMPRVAKRKGAGAEGGAPAARL